MVSVALPVWNSKKIAWLCMESLCRQYPAQWELIVFEESHDEALGKDWFMSYGERLRQTGCERVLYMTQEEKLPLPQKWVEIAKMTDRDSQAFLMCAADNYYHPWMVQDATAAIHEADWCLMTKGYFYDFSLDQVFYYHHTGIVGLTMAAKTSLVRKFEKSDIKKGIDSWFANQMIKVAHEEGILLRCFMDGSEHYKNMLCTNGYNNISKGRINLLEKYQEPFYKTDVKLNEIVPQEIYERCLSLR